MADTKKYLLTSLILGLIACGGALLIATTNMFTKGPIAKNEENKINSGIANIFGDGAKVSTIDTIDDSAYTYVNTRYVLDNNLGYAFRTDGFNSYGKISLIIGFDTSYAYQGLSVITNEQSFATTLNKNYIAVIKDGDDSKIDDVSCGATYGAKLVRAMINEAQQAAKDLAGE